jgi:hypothetical protein
MPTAWDAKGRIAEREGAGITIEPKKNQLLFTLGKSQRAGRCPPYTDSKITKELPCNIRITYAIYAKFQAN